MNSKSLYRKICFISTIILIACSLLFIYYHKPLDGQSFLRCPFYSLSGLFCPGCGSLRAFYQLLHGRFLQAWDLNPLMLLFLPFLVYAFFREGLSLMANRTSSGPFIPALIIKFILIIILAYCILRNIPFYPFNLLAP